MSHDTFTIKPFPPARQFFVDGMDFGGRPHCMHGLIEVDITIPRQRILEIKQTTGEALSFTGFVAYCCAQVVDQNKRVQAYLDWRNRLILFDDVDVCAPVERPGGSIFSWVIIRSAQRKSLNEIHQEIRQEQARVRAPATGGGFPAWYPIIPRFLRHLFFRYLYARPDLLKKYIGTVMVTSVGMFGRGAGWGIAPIGNALTVTIGGIVPRPCLTDGQLENREHVCLTISLDHSLIDGAPAARFMEQLKEAIESGSGLFEEKTE
jgi:pyruvate/2-oxoglutarate dehydrogenase complex dihydrolipoamide acyltransferase (E2) component